MGLCLRLNFSSCSKQLGDAGAGGQRGGHRSVAIQYTYTKHFSFCNKLLLSNNDILVEQGIYQNYFKLFLFIDLLMKCYA